MADTQIISMDHRIIWLVLCSAKVKAYQFPINEAIAEIFVNKELYFMLNSLKYLEVYEILIYTVELSRLKVGVYERILDNLSTFIIYISERSKEAAGSSFYLNHRYS